MKKLKILKLSRDFRYLQKLALKGKAPILTKGAGSFSGLALLCSLKIGIPVTLNCRCPADNFSVLPHWGC